MDILIAMAMTRFRGPGARRRSSLHDAAIVLDVMMKSSG